MEKKENLATLGGESYDLAAKDKKSDKIVLNIQEENANTPIILRSVEPKKKRNGLIAKINHFLVSHSKVKIEDKATFFHLLAVMVNAGIPMVKALRALSAQMKKSPRMQIVIDEIAQKIEDGDSFSKAMLDYEEIFSDQEIGMAQSGEASGQLSNVLENLATYGEKAYEIKRKVKSALMYPVIVFLLLIAIMVAMMVWVVPKLTDLFSSVGKDLPLITKIVVGISDFMVSQQINLLIGAGVLFVGFILFQRTDVGRLVLDTIKLKLPVFGKLFQEAYLSRFASSLSNLLNSQITIVRTMEITANSIGNEVYRRKLLLAMEDIKQGIPLAESLTGSPLFSPMLINMIEVGETTAQLDTMMDKVAEFYEKEVDETVSGLSKLLEPLIIMVIAVAVGGVVAAIMLPIMQLSDLSGVV